MKSEIIVGYDGRKVPDGFTETELLPKDLVKNGNLAFVGLVLNSKQTLLSLPKYFVASENPVNESPHEKLKQARLVLQVILKFMTNDRNNNLSPLELNLDQQSERINNSFYSLLSFWRVYSYYLRYGWYHQELIQSRLGDHGRIDWHRTVQIAPKLIDGGNLYFGGFYRYRRQEQTNFVTLCMKYVIYHTISLFGDLLAIPYPEELSSIVPAQLNPEAAVAELSDLLSRTFKDRDRELLISLINFFQDNQNSDEVVLVIPNFQSVWETMVAKYLNRHVQGVGDNGQPDISPHVLPADQQLVFKKPNMKPDQRKDKQGHQGDMEPDYVADNDTTLFIYDAKYYGTDNHPDVYKQLAYAMMLGNQGLYSDKDAFQRLSTAFILPSRGQLDPKCVFKITEDEYNPLWPVSLAVYECYLNFFTVMKDYVSEPGSQSLLVRLKQLAK